MQPNEETNIINSVMFGVTIVTFICIAIFTDLFAGSFLQNLFMVPFVLLGSLILGNIAVGIPSFIYYYLSTVTFEDFYNLPKKKQRIIIAVTFATICIVIAFIGTYI